MIDVKTFITGI